MSPNRQRISARDYKHGGRDGGGFDFAKYRQFGLGLLVGAVVAAGLTAYLYENAEPLPETAVTPEPRGSKEGDAEVASETEDPAEQYDFYDMLPKFEVVIAEQESDVRRDVPSVPVEQAGAYMIQVGSYRNLPDAERLKSQLAKQGIDAAIQRIAIDADVWHRVRIGPFRDLQKLNATRQQLRTADLDPIVIRVAD